MDDPFEAIWRDHREELTDRDGPSSEVFFPGVMPEDLIACLHFLKANAREYLTLCTWHPDALGEVAGCLSLADTLERLFNGAVTQFGVDYTIELPGFAMHMGLLVAPASPVELDVDGWFNAADVFTDDADHRARFQTLAEHLLTLRGLLGDPPAYLGWGPDSHPEDDAGDWIRLA